MIRIEFDNLNEALKAFNDIKDCKTFTYGDLHLNYDKDCNHFIIVQSFYAECKDEKNDWWKTSNYNYKYLYYRWRPHWNFFTDYADKYIINKMIVDK